MQMTDPHARLSDGASVVEIHCLLTRLVRRPVLLGAMTLLLVCLQYTGENLTLSRNSVSPIVPVQFKLRVFPTFSPAAWARQSWLVRPGGRKALECDASCSLVTHSEESLPSLRYPNG